MNKISIGVSAKCWFARDEEYGMWDEFRKNIELPVVPRVGEIVQLLFVEDGKTRNIKIMEVKYKELGDTFAVLVYGEEIELLGK